MLAGIIATFLIWIHNGQRLRDAVRPGQVVVGDDQVDSNAPHSFRRGEGANAGVDADDEPHAVGGGAFNHFVAHAIAFADAMRHVKLSRSPAKLNGRLENDDCRRAIDVVVAVNQNFFFALQRRFQPIQSGFHAAHPQRVVEVGKRRRQKTGRRLGLVDSAPDQQIGKHGQGRRRNFQFGIMQCRCQDASFRRIQRIGDPSHLSGVRS